MSFSELLVCSQWHCLNFCILCSALVLIKFHTFLKNTIKIFVVIKFYGIWGEPERPPTLAVSNGMYKCHACTNDEWQNTVSMICTSVTCTEGEQWNAGSMVTSGFDGWKIPNKYFHTCREEFWYLHAATCTFYSSYYCSAVEFYSGW